MMNNFDIKAGDLLKCNDKEGIIGAILKYKNKNCILTAYHILKVGKCNIGDKVCIGEFEGRLIEILINYDLALIEIYAHESVLVFSDIATPEIGPAYALKEGIRNPCNVLTTGKTYHYLSFSFRTLPLPGDSGSPIIQNGKVVGI
ncbi:MAG: hypothetical protein ACXVHY_11905, partial [Methanobacterium sp.]